MVKVFGMFPSGQFTPEIIAASSERDAVKRAISNGSIQRHEVRDADIRELTADEVVFWSDRTVSDRELCIKALASIWTAEAELMKGYLQSHEAPSIYVLILDLFDQSVSLKEQYGCWCALAIALTRYKPSVQRDRILRDVEGEVSWLQAELRNEFLASMQDEIDKMEEFRNAA